MRKMVCPLQCMSILMAALLAVVLAIFLTKTSGSEKPLEEVSRQAIALFENENAEESSAITLKKYYGLNADEYEDFVLYFPRSNMDAEELLILRLSDDSQADEVISALKERNLSQCNVYEGYAPAQYALCRNAIIDVQGNYILYVVHTDAARIDAAFQEAL